MPTVAVKPQGPKKRGARRIQVCPSSEEQRARWQAAAKRARLSLSAWLTWLADAASAPPGAAGS